MSWTGVWIGGSLALGVFLGATLMSLLMMSRDSESEDGQAPPGPEGKGMRNCGRPVAAAGSGRFPETPSVEDPILTHDAWEAFDAKTGGIC